MEKEVAGHSDNEKPLKDRIFAGEYKYCVNELSQATKDKNDRAP